MKKREAADGIGSGAVLGRLMGDDVSVVFDIDGVLVPYEFGPESHVACSNDEWEEYVRKNRPYSRMKPAPAIAEFIRDKGTDRIYVCSVAEEYENEDKGMSVRANYGIPDDHIFFVPDRTAKENVLRMIAEKDGGKVALVDDTVATLDRIHENTPFMTVHVSSFLYYGSGKMKNQCPPTKAERNMETCRTDEMQPMNPPRPCLTDNATAPYIT